MKKIIEFINKIFAGKICEGCGEKPTSSYRSGNMISFYRCKCTMYKLACSRPIKKEKYIDDYGVECSKWIYAQDIYPEEYLRKDAERMFNDQF